MFRVKLWIYCLVIWLISILVGGIPTPLKNIRVSFAIIIPKSWKVIQIPWFQSPPSRCPLWNPVDLLTKLQPPSLQSFCRLVPKWLDGVLSFSVANQPKKRVFFPSLPCWKRMVNIRHKYPQLCLWYVNICMWLHIMCIYIIMDPPTLSCWNQEIHPLNSHRLLILRSYVTSTGICAVFQNT